MGMRISGLASGMDIDQLVGNLMKANRKPLDKLYQTKQTIEWQRDGFRDMNNLLKEFDKFIFEGIYRESNIKPKKVASTDETKVSATASASAGNVSYSIDKVDQLATAATKSSADSIIAKDASFDPNKSMREMNTNGAFASGITWSADSLETITVGSTDATSIKLGSQNIKSVGSLKVYDAKGKEIYSTTNPSNDLIINNETGEISRKDGTKFTSGSIVDVQYVKNEKDTINITSTNTGSAFKLSKAGINTTSGMTDIKITDAGGTSQSVTTYFDKAKFDNDTTNSQAVYINQETGELTFKAPLAEGSKIEATYVTDKSNFTLASYNKDGNQVRQSFTFDSTQSLNQVLSQIRNSGVGINAFYDDFSKKVSFTRKETGDFNKNGDEIQLEGAFLTDTLKFSNVKESGGANAKFTINGMDTERNSNTFELNGISFTLKSTFASSVTVTTTNDSDQAFDTIVKFVNKYNETIDKINGKLTEKRYRDYPPLTDDQRKDMKDGDIKLWEEKAKSGMLRNDTILSSGLNKMREQMYTPVSGTSGQYTQISELGITTTKNFLDRGKLEIDETKLKKALTDNPDDVYKLLMNDGATTSEKGIARRMRDTIKETMVKIEDKAGNTLKTNQQFVLGRDLDDIEKRMATMDDRLKQMEDRYYRQFTAMEQAIQRANAQSSQFLQQLGSGK